MKGVIRLQDKLSQGGIVITVSSNANVLGREIALVGDIVSCSVDGHGINSIIEGSHTWKINNTAVALDGCLCACGCRVLSSLSSVGSDT